MQSQEHGGDRNLGISDLNVLFGDLDVEGVSLPSPIM